MISLYKKIRRVLFRFLELATCISVMGLLFVLLLQIFARIIKFSCPDTMVWANMLLMWISFPAACLGLEKKMQLGVDFLYNMLSIKYRCFMDVVVGISIMVFSIFAMVYGGSFIAVSLFKNSEFIRFMFYVPLIISGFVMIMQGGERILYGIFGIHFEKEEE